MLLVVEHRWWLWICVRFIISVKCETHRICVRFIVGMRCQSHEEQSSWVIKKPRITITALARRRLLLPKWVAMKTQSYWRAPKNGTKQSPRVRVSVVGFRVRIRVYFYGCLSFFSFQSQTAIKQLKAFKRIYIYVLELPSFLFLFLPSLLLYVAPSSPSMA